MTTAGRRTSSQAVTLADSPNLDAFSRLRVSDQTTLLDTKLHTGISALRWSTAVVGGGTVTAAPTTASAALAVTAAANDSALMQSKQRGIYQPGKSLLFLCTFVMGAAAEGVTKYAGMFDSQDGVLLRQEGDGTLSVGIRKGGADTWVTQASWNLDTLTGAGGVANPSDITLDITKNQIFFGDLEWLGVGRVRVGFNIAGNPVYVHEFTHANSGVGPYMNNPNLPISYHIATDGTTAGSMTAICATIISEGGVDDLGRIGSVNLGATARSMGASREELLAIRLGSDFVRKAMIVPVSVSVHQTNAPFLWEMVLNPVGPAGGAWTAVTNTFIEQNIGRTGTVTGGYVLASGYVSTSIDAADVDLSTVIAAASDAAGAADVLSLVVTNVSGVDRDYHGAITYRELA